MQVISNDAEDRLCKTYTGLAVTKCYGVTGGQSQMSEECQTPPPPTKQGEVGKHQQQQQDT